MTLPLVQPIVPVLARSVPRGRQWRYEVKLDGFRGILYVQDGGGFFRSKSQRRMRRFDELAAALARALPVRDAIFDGEILATTAGRPDFYRLMFSRGSAEYAAFDLLWLNGRDLRPMTLGRRKAALQRLLARQAAIAFVEAHREPELFDLAVAMDLEGIVAKRAGDAYAAATEWLKVKHRGYSQNVGRREFFDRGRRK